MSNIPRLFINRFFRALFRGAQGFIEDDCYSKATALSYYTLLSLVPILAVAFGIAKGFGFEKSLETEILEYFYQQQTFAEKVIGFARSTLEQTQGSLIAGVGVILLFWSALGLLGNFERALNTIWKVPVMRDIKQKITDYLPLLIFFPIVIVAASSLIFMVTSKVMAISVSLGIYATLKPLIHLSYYVLLWLLNWALFSFLYIYIPNRTVPWESCIIAALFAALAFQITQWAYIHFQMFLSSYNAIYGSFAAVPLFLLWLQISWLIVLAGAEVAQHYATSGHLGKEIAYTSASERELTLLIMMVCCRPFSERKTLYDAASIASTFHLPLLETSKIVSKCLQANLLIEVVESTGHRRLAPAADPKTITLDDILKSVDTSRDKYCQVAATPELQSVEQFIAPFDASHQSLPSNVTLQQMLS